MEEPSQEAATVVPVVEAEAVVEAKGRNFFTSMQKGVSKFGADLRTLSGVGAAASTVAVVQPSLSSVELAEQDIGAWRRSLRRVRCGAHTRVQRATCSLSNPHAPFSRPQCTAARQ